MILLAALATAILIWWLVKAGLRADPAKLSRLVKQGGGVLAFGVALLLLLRGRIDMAVLVGGAGVALLGSTRLALPSGLRWPWQRRPGQVPGPLQRTRSATVEIEWDRRSGRITGTVLAGPFAGRELDSMSAAELDSHAELCARSDHEGGVLLQAYLDRRFAGRGEHAQRNADARLRPKFQGGAMTPEEAYEVLGLQPGATDAAIRQTHRELMKKLHPDGGGSTYLASRVNQAKDVLLGRHR